MKAIVTGTITQTVITKIAECVVGRFCQLHKKEGVTLEFPTNDTLIINNTTCSGITEQVHLDLRTGQIIYTHEGKEGDSKIQNLLGPEWRLINHASRFDVIRFEGHPMQEPLELPLLRGKLWL